MNETPKPKGSLWDEQKRAAQEREREREAAEQRRRSANNAAARRAALLAPFIQRYAELVAEEKRLAALVDSFVPLVPDERARVNYTALAAATDFRLLASARAELQAVRDCMELLPDEAKPAARTAPDPRAQCQGRRATLERDVREWSEQAALKRAALSETRTPPPDARSGRALLQWRENETIRVDQLESDLRRLDGSIADAERELSRLGDE